MLGREAIAQPPIGITGMSVHQKLRAGNNHAVAGVQS